VVGIDEVRPFRVSKGCTSSGSLSESSCCWPLHPWSEQCDSLMGFIVVHEHSHILCSALCDPFPSSKGDGGAESSAVVPFEKVEVRRVEQAEPSAGREEVVVRQC
jgi:hypothetical protein